MYSIEICEIDGCREHIELDNCDADFDGQTTHYYKGSSQGFECKSCMKWACNRHGDAELGECDECKRFYLTPLGKRWLEIPAGSPIPPDLLREYNDHFAEQRFRVVA